MLERMVDDGVFGEQIEGCGPVRSFSTPILLFDPDYEIMTDDNSNPARNVLGRSLATCSTEPLTGYFRDGCCKTGPSDLGVHVVCAEVTEAFLSYTKSRGNDLSTPRPEFRFPGLKPGDRWCLCATRWLEAHEAGVAPPVHLAATHEKALEIVPREILFAAALEESGM